MLARIQKLTILADEVLFWRHGFYVLFHLFRGDNNHHPTPADAGVRQQKGLAFLKGGGSYH
jgi:hypothetical protein